VAKTEVIVLTNCTNRKRVPVPAEQTARSLPPGNIAHTSQKWVSRLKRAAHVHVADQLYCGRGLTETLSAAQGLGGEIAFISAGLGVVAQRQCIPSYSLTTSSGYPDSVGSRVTGSFDPVSWWRALARAQGGSDDPLRDFLAKTRARLVLCAMPATYLELVAHEIARLPASVLRTVRLIGPRRREDVSDALRPYWMPYDARLDAPETGYNGTASDFPHRALRHFSVEVLPRVGMAACRTQAAYVENTLAHFSPYVRPRGQTASDDEVMSEIKVLWKRHEGRRTGILRALRSERHIACEQTRFRLLMDKFEENRNGSAQTRS
jgi:hypothetical protein